MLFCDNPTDRFYERLMQTVPKHRKKDTFDTPDSTLIMSFLRMEGEEYMVFKNEKHRMIFEEIIRKKDKKDYALMAALYLLTADLRLWNTAKHHIEKTAINFKEIKLKGIHESGYALFCGAKDLYTGTRHLCITDLADTELIPPKLFGLFCNAMAIRRCGLGAINNKERTEKNDTDNRKM